MGMKVHKSLDQILSDFNPTKQIRRPSLKEGAPVSVWLPQEYKTRYDRLQALSGRQFSEKLRQLMIAAIETAETKTTAA